MQTLDHLFERHFGADGPTIRVRCPGRVNLIGEHIDYNGLPVLPMAVQREVRVRLRPRDDRTVRIVNADASYGDRTFEAVPEIEPYASGDWGNYVKAAVRGLARRYGTRRGFDAVVASDLPAAAGLSSSSALVIASGLAALAAAGRTVPRLELAVALADAERFVGTRGGGMDQAICLTARAGTAGRVDFDPLRVDHLPIPEGWTFVVADSGERAEKSGAAREEYNRRTRESRDALRRVIAELRRRTGREGGDAHSRPRRERAADAREYEADAREHEADAPSTGVVDPNPPGGYPALLAVHPLPRLLATAADVLDGQWRRRFRHVVTEADRVGRAERALVDRDPVAFGRLMLASHRSLRDDYEVSTLALDEVVEIARGAGAYGARLTGAGFGGCALLLADEARIDAVLDALVDGFYHPRGLDASPDRLFTVRPAPGASAEGAPTERT